MMVILKALNRTKKKYIYKFKEFKLSTEGINLDEMGVWMVNYVLF